MNDNKHFEIRIYNDENDMNNITSGYKGDRCSISAGLCCLFQDLIQNKILTPKDILFCYKIILEQMLKNGGNKDENGGNNNEK